MCAEQSCGVLQVYGRCRCMYTPLKWTLHRSHKRELAAVGVETSTPSSTCQASLVRTPCRPPESLTSPASIISLLAVVRLEIRSSSARGATSRSSGGSSSSLRTAVTPPPPSRGRTLRLSSHRKARTHPRREREKKNLISLMHLASPPPPPPISRRYSRFLLLAGSQPQQDERAKNWFTRRRPRSGC